MRRTKVISTNGELVKRPGILNVGKGCLKFFELEINLLLGLLSFLDLYGIDMVPATRTENETNGLGLEGLNGLYVRTDIVGNGLEVLQNFLGLVNDSLVLQNGAVVGKINGGGLAGVLCVKTLSLSVALAEGLEGRNGLWNAT